MKDYRSSLFALAIFLSVSGCKDVIVPKPSAHLRLEYPATEYARFENHCPFTFDMNADVIIKEKGFCNFTVDYPRMKATLYLSYQPVNNNIDLLLRDAQKLTYKHVVKADDILEQPYVNPNSKVYGMFYTVSGNAATNTQFYATDSVKHFVTGSVYFYTKPNFDSIFPAANFIRSDMRVLMETLKWK
jgi:gliding motility-associated lipoprotein GldD